MIQEKMEYFIWAENIFFFNDENQINSNRFASIQCLFEHWLQVEWPDGIFEWNSFV